MIIQILLDQVKKGKKISILHLKAIKWRHALCGGKTYLRLSNLYIRCSNCKTTGVILDWKFSCGDHKYVHMSRMGFYLGMSMLGQLNNLS